MPGTESDLQRHEWIKHGTCYGGSPEEYFAEAISLLDKINKSSVQAVIASHIGEKLAFSEIDQALLVFDSSAPDKAEVKCNKSAVMSELWFNLKGEITPDTSIGSLLVAAPAADADDGAACLIDDART